MPFMCFGQCFHIILPAITITIGMIKSHININHQNHIKSTSASFDLSFFSGAPAPLFPLSFPTFGQRFALNFLCIKQTGQRYILFLQVQHHSLFPWPHKPPMFVKLIGTGIVCVDINKLSLLIHFKCGEQCRTDPLNFAVGISGKKNDLSVRRTLFAERLQILHPHTLRRLS